MADTDAPTKAPKRADPVQAETSDAPTLSYDQFTPALAAGGVGAAPSMVPPGEESQAALQAEGITAWHNSKKITSMWSNSSSLNAYAGVDGMGWKKISNSNPSSFVSLVAILSLAEQTGAATNLRIEADGEIHEAYVF